MPDKREYFRDLLQEKLYITLYINLYIRLYILGFYNISNTLLINNIII